MTAVLLGSEPHNTPAWHALRSSGLGGSEIAAVVGLSPWVSKYALYLRKRGEIPEQANQTRFDWGHRLEPVIAQVWADLHSDQNVEEAGTYQHADRPWQLANVDRLITDDEFLNKPHAILEVKTAHQYDAYEWGNGPEDIPPYYRCQVVWYMDVIGVPVGHLAVLIGGSDYREYTIPYVADEAEWLREEGRKFWADVQSGNKPPLDGSDATYEAVRKEHPEIERGQDVEIEHDLYGWYLETKADAAAAKAEHQKAKASLLAQMGDAQRALIGGLPVLRRQPGRGGNVSLQPIPQSKGRAA